MGLHAGEIEMHGLKVRLSLVLLIVFLAAIDIAGIKYVIAPRGTGNLLNVYVLNALPMTNVLLLLAYSFARSRREHRPFAVGFFVVGLVSLMAQLIFDLTLPDVTWKFYDSALEASMRLARSGIIDLSNIRLVVKGYIVYFPIMVVVFAAPQFVAAVIGGLVVRGMSRRLERMVA
jgi:hypothetical protein